MTIDQYPNRVYEAYNQFYPFKDGESNLKNYFVWLVMKHSTIHSLKSFSYNFTYV